MNTGKRISFNFPVRLPLPRVVAGRSLASSPPSSWQFNLRPPRLYFTSILRHPSLGRKKDRERAYSTVSWIEQKERARFETGTASCPDYNWTEKKIVLRLKGKGYPSVAWWINRN